MATYATMLHINISPTLERVTDLLEWQIQVAADSETPRTRVPLDSNWLTTYLNTLPIDLTTQAALKYVPYLSELSPSIAFVIIDWYTHRFFPVPPERPADPTEAISLLLDHAISSSTHPRIVERISHTTISIASNADSVASRLLLLKLEILLFDSLPDSFHKRGLLNEVYDARYACRLLG